MTRCWRGSVPAALLLLGYARLGLVGAAAVLAVGFVAATVWQVIAPASFAWHVTQRAQGAWRWHTKYRRRWVPATSAAPWPTGCSPAMPRDFTH